MVYSGSDVGTKEAPAGARQPPREAEAHPEVRRTPAREFKTFLNRARLQGRPLLRLLRDYAESLLQETWRVKHTP